MEFLALPAGRNFVLIFQLSFLHPINPTTWFPIFAFTNGIEFLVFPTGNEFWVCDWHIIEIFFLISFNWINFLFDLHLPNGWRHTWWYCSFGTKTKKAWAWFERITQWCFRRYEKFVKISWNQLLCAFWKSTKLFTYNSEISWFHEIFESE